MNDRPDWTTGLENLADPDGGAAVIQVSDEFFAPAKRMLMTDEPRNLPDRFEEHGKWMDGWESRRRRDDAHDWCVLRIRPGIVHGVDIDTRHFIGNYPAEASLEACRADTDPGANCEWTEILARSRLGPDRHHYFALERKDSWTHLRLHVYPDGGVARLRIFGEPALAGIDESGCIDLVSRSAGGRAVYCNDMHFGHMDNLISPGEPESMADGWETRRRRKAGNDFVILQLGQPGQIQRAVINTAWFRGNYPARASLRGALIETDGLDAQASGEWPFLLEPLALGPDQSHVFERQLKDVGAVSHVRMDIFPDGGVARIRLLGRPSG